MIKKLYQLCFNYDNIIKAINYIKWQVSEYNSELNYIGKDNINCNNELSITRIIKEVKLRLRRRKAIGYIIENNNIKLNFFDLVTHQCIYQIIQPIIDQFMISNNYAFRKNINPKLAICKLADSVTHKQEIYGLQFNLKKYFDTVSLDQILYQLYQYNIKDKMLIWTIKHMLIYKCTEGNQFYSHSNLESIIYNCYLDIFDQYMNNNYELQKVKTHYTRDYNNHKLNWISWIQSRNKLIHCRYYRYLYDILIIVDNKEEQKYIYDQLSIIFMNNNIILNKMYNKFIFLKFLIKKSTVEKHSAWIRIANPQLILNELKQFNFYDIKDCIYFLHWLRHLLKYYDIVNDLSYILSCIYDRLYYRSKRSNTILVKKDAKYWFKNAKTKTCIDIFQLRKLSKTSFKEYLLNSSWILKRDQLKLSNFANEYRSFLWILWTKQKGLDAITKKPLDIKNIHIHHIIPIYKQGLNTIDNLILVSEETHKQLHYGLNKDKSFEKYRKYL